MAEVGQLNTRGGTSRVRNYPFFDPMHNNETTPQNLGHAPAYSGQPGTAARRMLPHQLVKFQHLTTYIRLIVSDPIETLDIFREASFVPR